MKAKEIINHLKNNGESIRDDDSEFDQDELRAGTKVEMEHTNNKKAAKEIAKDHLKEIPDYYTRLEKMEKKAFKEQKHS